MKYSCWILFIALMLSHASAQVITPENTYRLLLQQLRLLEEYYPIGSEEEQLINEADNFAKDGEFEIAIIYLEEVLSLMKEKEQDIDFNIKNLSNPPTFSIPIPRFNFSILTGIDFNRQEFEMGYIQDDSTIFEEISKPYVGIMARFFHQYSGKKYIEISNSFRYDQQNWRDDYRIQWQALDWLSLEYGGYWNQSKEIETNCFWEHQLYCRAVKRYSSGFSWTIQEYFNYKTYRQVSSFLSNYYRNRLNILMEWYSINNRAFSVEYMNELNEYLGHDNMDYFQNGIRLGYRKSEFQSLNYSIILEGIFRDYSLQFEDSTVNNTYKQGGLEAILDIPIINTLRFEIVDNFYLKEYDVKSSLEPDYKWNLMRSGLFFYIRSDFELGVGYEWELKKHDATIDEIYNSSEQDYHSSGFYASINYYTTSGIYFTTVLSYQWRRYQNSVINELISIYSNRNILSIMVMGYLPLSNHLTINAFATYDDDDDIDLDQQNNQSTIFSLEIEYKF